MPLPRAKKSGGESSDRVPTAEKRRSPRRADQEEQPVRLTEVVRGDPEPAPARRRGTGTPVPTGPGRDEIRAMIAEGPQLIEDGLQIYTEDDEPKGVGYGTPVGEIDLLARDGGGAWVVVLIPEMGHEKELVSDLLELMGWVRKHLCEVGQDVRAIALLDPAMEDLGYAAAAVADTVEFMRYQLALTFEPLEI